MTAPRPPLQGRKLGDRRVVVSRPHSDFFRYAGPGTMVAKASASAPTTGSGRFFARVRGALFGKPLANAEEIGERLSKKLALPIFSSDLYSLQGRQPSQSRRRPVSASNSDRPPTARLIHTLNGGSR